MPRNPSPPLSRSLVEPRPIPQRFRSARHVPWAVSVPFWVLVADSATRVVLELIRLFTTDWTQYIASRVHSFVHNGHRLEVSPAIVIGTIVFGFAIAAFAVAVRTGLAVFILGGFGWARWVVSIIAAASLMFLVGDALSGAGRGSVALTVLDDVATLVEAASAVLLWLPSAREYFQGMTADRLYYRATRFR